MIFVSLAWGYPLGAASHEEASTRIASSGNPGMMRVHQQWSEFFATTIYTLIPFFQEDIITLTTF